MVDITHKSSTLRYARAQAIVKMGSPATMESIKNKSVPKGDVFEMAKAAALFAIKRTSDVIPDCHPLPIEFAAVHYFPEEMELKIEVEVKTIYKTGVEVEAMHGASIAALTAYDMLKPIDKHIEITGIKLIEKKGGKTDFKEEYRSSLSAAVIVCSDSISAGQKEDRAGKAIINKLEFLKVKVGDYTVIPDEQDKIRETVQKLAAAKYNMVILTGGTGLSKRDVTPEALKPLLERDIPGIAEAMRSYGQERTPYSMLSRSLAGLIGETLVLALPGSTKGAEESMDALFPHILHIFRVMEALRHD
ncbi:MAG: bifunctional molybdenum cofactor biosynthesis protein MoaC/MoaB [Bacteroidetes bacterium]|nr:bifunctional molybdenum cofactor biosynthesis protein MoaC/MoaB [Bacteroidota bacterium]MBL0064414.1 bifunctional molybdenum cofactor biosynthesis protein MoaC/MoaB [Bacteroidota bacterium]MBL0137659.1 bifunctional molybdenum cofactor biosynthesis protein MoaC/MoaB [Bacteroidota bacterium]